MSSFELNEKVNDYFDIIAEIEKLQAQAEAIKKEQTWETAKNA